MLEVHPKAGCRIQPTYTPASCGPGLQGTPAVAGGPRLPFGAAGDPGFWNSRPARRRDGRGRPAPLFPSCRRAAL